MGNASCGVVLGGVPFGKRDKVLAGCFRVYDYSRPPIYDVAAYMRGSLLGRVNNFPINVASNRSLLA